jgi:exonuclease SbcD
MTDSMECPLTLIHTSDWHLGHVLYNHEREAEHDAFLAWLLTQLDEQDADVLLVTGDVYDIANPTISTMRRLFAFLNEAVQRRSSLQVVMLGGNHDSAGRIDLPAALLGEGRIRFVGALPRRDGAPDCAALMVPLLGPDGAPAALLAAVPFCRPSDLGRHTLAALYAEVAEHAVATADGLPVVLTGHLHVAGGAESELSERRIVVGGQEAEASSLFDGRAAYVALGHLHRPQTIPGPAPIRYAGSPFPLSATERDYCHSLTVVSLTPTDTTWREVPIPRPVPFMVVPAEGVAPLDEVVGMLETLLVDDEVTEAKRPFLEVSVLVEGPEPHLQTRVLKALEGKPVRLTRVLKVQSGEAQSATAKLEGADLAELRPEEVFAAVWHKAYPASDLPNDLTNAFAELLVDVNTGDLDTDGAA